MTDEIYTTATTTIEVQERLSKGVCKWHHKAGDKWRSCLGPCKPFSIIGCTRSEMLRCRGALSLDGGAQAVSYGTMRRRPAAGSLYLAHVIVPGHGSWDVLRDGCLVFNVGR